MSIKEGTKYFYFKNYNNHISIEWSFRPLDIFNFNLTFDGTEHEYIFTFWFIFVFYISTNIFKKYPKEWNSYANEYLDTGIRKIGITQYHGYTEIFIWHSGEPSYHKDYNLFYFNIDLVYFFIGEHSYLYKDISHFTDYKEFTEGLQKIHGKTIKLTKTYNRWYMKPFNKHFYYIYIDSDIKCPFTRITTSHNNTSIKDYLDNEYTAPVKRYLIEKNENIDIYIDKYIKLINTQREKYYKNWVPYKYLKSYRRKQKLNKIFKSKK